MTTPRRVHSAAVPYLAGSAKRSPGRRGGASKAAAPAMAKLFANGRSQAVRLPKEFRLPGTEVRISREGACVILEPLVDGPCDANGWPLRFWEEIDRLLAGGEIPDIEPLGGRLLTPEEIDPSVAWRP